MLPALKAAHTFDRLHSLVQGTVGGLRGIGPLTVYDTANRLGGKRNLEPTRVLSYELEMLFLTGEILLTSPEPVTVRDVTVKNALIESFAIHLRVLTDFIDDTGSKPDDVLAKHFVRDESKWRAARPAVTAEVAEASGARANKEVAHLTTGRVFGTPPAKAWDVRALRAAVADRLRVFIEDASPARLHPRFGERLNALTSGRVDLDARFAP